MWARDATYKTQTPVSSCSASGDKSTEQKDIDKAHELADQWYQDRKKEGTQ